MHHVDQFNCYNEKNFLYSDIKTVHLTHSCLILIQVARIMIKLNKLTEIDKLSTTFKAKSSADVNITHVHGGSHILLFLFNMRGWLHG